MEKACNVVCPETSLQCHLSGPHVRQSYGPIPDKSINKMLMRKLSLEESFWLRTRGSRVRGGIQDQPHTGASLLGMCLHDSRTAGMSYTLTHTIHRPYFPSPARTKGWPHHLQALTSSLCDLLLSSKPLPKSPDACRV